MIAALSPALCNFEETFSTLKYANRAKAIKVRAVKNDESSQIGRLNEEIRALKEKLLDQATTVRSRCSQYFDDKFSFAEMLCAYIPG